MIFNLLDRTYSAYQNSRFAKTSEKPKEIIVKKNDDSRMRTVCFVPTSVLSMDWLSRRLLPSSGTNYVFPVSSQYHMTPDWRKTAGMLKDVCDRASQITIEGIRRGEIVNMLGISLGTSLVSRLAGEFPCKDLTLVVPGDRLGECAAESSLTGPIVARTKSVDDYCETLREFDPIDHEIRTRNVEVYIGGRDLLIPAVRGRTLAEKLRERNPETRVTSWQWADHFTTIGLSAFAMNKDR